MTDTYAVGNLVYDGYIYDGVNTHDSDLPFYAGRLQEKKSGKILELCCGTGRLTLPLAEQGFNITGVDISKTMLDRAKNKTAETNLDITFIEADIRYLTLPDTYDAIFIPFNSIHHLYKTEDLFLAFNAVKAHLKPDGYFLLDCFNPDIQYIVENENKTIVAAEYTTEDGRQVVVKQTMHYENDTQINRIKWHYTINGKFDSTQPLDMRMYYPRELDAYLKISGFEILHKFGDFNEDEFNAQSSKQIFVCKLSS